MTFSRQGNKYSRIHINISSSASVCQCQYDILHISVDIYIVVRRKAISREMIFRYLIQSYMMMMMI